MRGTTAILLPIRHLMPEVTLCYSTPILTPKLTYCFKPGGVVICIKSAEGQRMGHFDVPVSG